MELVRLPFCGESYVFRERPFADKNFVFVDVVFHDVGFRAFRVKIIPADEAFRPVV